MNTAIVSILLLAAGAATVWLAWLGSQRRLPRNRWAGIRLPSTMASDDAWCAAHEASAGPLGVSGGIMVLGGLAVAVSGLDNPFGRVALALAVVGSLSAMVAATRAAVAAARATAA